MQGYGGRSGQIPSSSSASFSRLTPCPQAIPNSPAAQLPLETRIPPQSCPAKGRLTEETQLRAICQGRLARLHIPAGIYHLLLSLRHPQETSWKQTQEATRSWALRVCFGVAAAGSQECPCIRQVLGKWQCPPPAEVKHPHGQLPVPRLPLGRHRSQRGVRT